MLREGNTRGACANGRISSSTLGVNWREVSQSASVSGSDHVDELLVRAHLIVVQDLCPRAGLQHWADLTEPVLPDLPVAHVEQDGPVVLHFRALDVARIDANA